MSEEDRSLQKTLALTERYTLLLTAVSQVGWAIYQIQFHILVANSFIALAVAFALTFVSARDTRGRFLHLLLQALVMSIACAFGAHRLYEINFLVLGAKAAVLLSGVRLFTIGGALLIGRIVAGAFAIYLMQHVFEHRVVSEFYTSVVEEIEGKIDSFVGIVTVLFLGRTVVAEATGRQVQQQLTKQAKELLVDYERENISHEIHDSIGHNLASLMIQLQLALKQLGEQRLDNAKETVSQSLDAAITCLRELRKAVKAMREGDATAADQTATAPLQSDS